MVAILRRFLSALHYVDNSRQSLQNAKDALHARNIKNQEIKERLDKAILESQSIFELINKELNKIMPQVDGILCIDFDKLDQKKV